MSTLISDHYRTLNSRLHDDNPAFGANAHHYAHDVADVYTKFQCNSLIDYGCGKGTLRKALSHRVDREYNVTNYDPAIRRFSAFPEPADMVACIDVLEHIEPDYLPDVLQHIGSLTNIVLFTVISTRPARKILADGRNAHLIVQPAGAWAHAVSSGTGLWCVKFEPTEDSVTMIHTRKGL